MTSSIRVLMLIALLSCGLFGVFTVFDLISVNEFTGSIGKFSFGIAIVLGVILAIKGLSPSESKQEPTDPPPTL